MKTPAPSPQKSSGPATPGIGKIDVLTYTVVGLFILALIAALYLAKVFFLPVIAAFIVGTMLSPAAGWLERRRIPRPLAAALIVTGACLAVGFIVALISSPLMQWGSRMPELGMIMRDKMHLFDRPLAIWHQIESMFGDTTEPANISLPLPKFDWMQPTYDFLSPTLTEMLLFFATLVLFVASWRDLRRAMILTFTDRNARLRILRILNAIETNLGGYLLTVTAINFGVGIATGVASAVAGMPNPAAIGALAATLNFFPIIGPIAMFAVLVVVGIMSFASLSAALLVPLIFAGIVFCEAHFITPTIIGRRLELNALAVLMALAFWTWLWGPMGGFLSSPLLIVALVVKEHLLPQQAPQLPQE